MFNRADQGSIIPALLSEIFGHVFLFYFMLYKKHKTSEFAIAQLQKTCSYIFVISQILTEGFLWCHSLSFTDAHAPEQRLVRGHGYRLPGVSRGNGFIRVGGAYQLPKLQDLVIWTEETHTELIAAVMILHFMVTLNSQSFQCD